MSRAEGEDWARQHGMLFIESSAKTQVGIAQVFDEVVQKVRPARVYFQVAIQADVIFLNVQILDDPDLVAMTVPAGRRDASRVTPGAGAAPAAGGGGCC